MEIEEFLVFCGLDELKILSKFLNLYCGFYSEEIYTLKQNQFKLK